MEGKTLETHVSFNATIDEDFKEEFESIINHHIDSFIDTDDFPEIKRVYNARLEMCEKVEEKIEAEEPNLFEIYFNDLNEDAQKRYLEYVGCETAADGNYDINMCPITIIDYPGVQDS